jgi:hypothetical protein
MRNHLNVVMALRPSLRTAEGFHDGRIADATSGPEAQALENHVNAIRVAGIDNGSIGVGRASTEFGGQGQLKRERDPESTFR